MQPMVGLDERLRLGIILGSSDGCTEGGVERVGLAEGVNEGAADRTFEGAALLVGGLLDVGA
jgi:hypothetical protein